MNQEIKELEYRIATLKIQLELIEKKDVYNLETFMITTKDHKNKIKELKECEEMLENKKLIEAL